MEITNWEMKKHGECFFCHVTEEELHKIIDIFGCSHEARRTLAERKVRLALKDLEQQVGYATRFAGNLRCDDSFKKADFDIVLKNFCTAFDEFLEIARKREGVNNEED